jgi:hypothetical protein
MRIVGLPQTEQGLGARTSHVAIDPSHFEKGDVKSVQQC